MTPLAFVSRRKNVYVSSTGRITAGITSVHIHNITYLYLYKIHSTYSFSFQNLRSSVIAVCDFHFQGLFVVCIHNPPTQYPKHKNKKIFVTRPICRRFHNVSQGMPRFHSINLTTGHPKKRKKRLPPVRLCLYRATFSPIDSSDNIRSGQFSQFVGMSIC